MGHEVKIHEHGYVKLLDTMGSDEDVVDAARISYDRRGSTEDRNLIRYLLRHKHTSPFEMAVMKFELKMPIFVARQFVRHRTASMNEVSARYTQLPEEMFVPAEFAVQSTDNKQGRGEEFSEHMQNILQRSMSDQNAASYSTYNYFLSQGVAKETAREVLNLNIYTKFVWKMDLHNLMHFLNLRLDPHAQQEIRDYAQAIENMIADCFPLCHEAFVDYVRDAYTCSAMEVQMLKYMAWFWYRDKGEGYLVVKCEDAGMSKREITEFRERFGIDG